MNFNNKIGDKYEKVCLILVKKFMKNLYYLYKNLKI